VGKQKTVLAIGAVGAIGTYVVDEAIAAGYKVKALILDAEKSANLPEEVDVAVGDFDDTFVLSAALHSVDGIILILGQRSAFENITENIDYAGIRNLLFAMAGKPIPIVMLTPADYAFEGNGLSQELYSLRKRSELLLRALGGPITIVRCGRIDSGLGKYPHLSTHPIGELNSNSKPEGILGRRQVAQVLVKSLFEEKVAGKIFDLTAEHGEPTKDFDKFFDKASQRSTDVQHKGGSGEGGYEWLSSEQPPDVMDDIKMLKEEFKQAMLDEKRKLEEKRIAEEKAAKLAESQKAVEEIKKAVNQSESNEQTA